MGMIEIIYDAKCKHCQFCETLKRKTRCKKKDIAIRQQDLACDQFKL